MSCGFEVKFRLKVRRDPIVFLCVNILFVGINNFNVFSFETELYERIVTLGLGIGMIAAVILAFIGIKKQMAALLIPVVIILILHEIGGIYACVKIGMTRNGNKDEGHLKKTDKTLLGFLLAFYIFQVLYNINALCEIMESISDIREKDNKSEGQTIAEVPPQNPGIHAPQFVHGNQAHVIQPAQMHCPGNIHAQFAYAGDEPTYLGGESTGEKNTE